MIEITRESYCHQELPLLLDLPDDLIKEICLKVINQTSFVYYREAHCYFLVSKKFKKIFESALRFSLSRALGHFPVLERKEILLEKASQFLIEKLKYDLGQNRFDFSSIKELLRAGANPNYKQSSSNVSCLCILLEHSQSNQFPKDEFLKLLSLFLEYGANANGTASKSSILTAIQATPADKQQQEFLATLVTLLCEKGANPFKKFKTTIQKMPISPYEYALKHNKSIADVFSKYVPPIKEKERINPLIAFINFLFFKHA